MTFVSQVLTPKNAEHEIRSAINLVVRYHVEQLGRQFDCWVDVNKRDTDREALVRMVICAVRGKELKQFWW